MWNIYIVYIHTYVHFFAQLRMGQVVNNVIVCGKIE